MLVCVVLRVVMRSSVSSAAAPSRRPASSTASATVDGGWESDPRFAAMAEEHERFLLMQQQYPRHYQPGRLESDAANELTFDSMADWDDAAAHHSLPASLSQHSAAYSATSAASRVLLDDEGGDEVSLDVVLAGIAAGRDADLLSRGVPLTELDREAGAGGPMGQQHYYQQSHYANEEQLDSSMLDSVLKALEEEEEELEDDNYQQLAQQQQQLLQLQQQQQQQTVHILTHSLTHSVKLQHTAPHECISVAHRPRTSRRSLTVAPMHTCCRITVHPVHQVRIDSGSLCVYVPQRCAVAVYRSPARSVSRLCSLSAVCWVCQWAVC